MKTYIFHLNIKELYSNFARQKDSEMSKQVRIAIFASGSGTNADNICHYFNQHSSIKVTAAFVNNQKAGVIEKMKKRNIPVILFDREMFYEKQLVLDELEKHEIDFIVLAGFLWKVPEKIVEDFESRIVNIHPALLPGYGGKGMYGHFVHKAVIENKEKVSGITIHLVNQDYDKGCILFQATCPVLDTDTPESLANRVHTLEYLHFPRVIEAWINSFK